VTDPLDMSQIVLQQLGELLRKITAEQVAELYAGTATLEVVGKAGRPAKKVAPAKKATAAPAVSTEQVVADLATIDDRAVATRYVTDLGLTVANLRVLAKDLGIAVASKAPKPEIVRVIVQWTVGRRVDAAAVSRPAPSAI
jgi:hypothetical protein